MKVNWELCPRQWRELKRLNSSGSQEAGRQQLWEDLEGLGKGGGVALGAG